MNTDKKTKEIALAALNALDFSASEISDLMDEFAFADRLTIEQKNRLIELHEYMTNKYRDCLNVLVSQKSYK